MTRLLLKNGMTLSIPDNLKGSEISKSAWLKGLIDRYEGEQLKKQSQRQENKNPRHVCPSLDGLS